MGKQSGGRKRATQENVQQAINGPDYEGALAIINGRIAAAKTAQSKASGDAGQGWASVEKLGVNKTGAQMFAKVQAIDDQKKQLDVLRTFAKLCDLEGIEIPADLVDMAGGKVTEVVPRAKPKAAIPPGPAGDTDLDEAGAAVATERAAAGGENPNADEPADDEDAGDAEEGEGPPQSQSAKVANIRDAIGKSKTHLGETLGGAPAPDALH